MARFEVTTLGRDALGMRKLCAEYVSGLWLPDHATLAQRAAIALDQFKRAVEQELQMLVVTFAAQEMGHPGPPS
jgi:hypothetical protein